MKRALLIVFGVVVLSFVASSVALAGEATEPVLVSPPEAAAAPVEPAVVAPAPDLSPDFGAIFLDSADDVAFQVCCQGAFATCAASCGGDVSAYSCSHVGSRGCSSSCACG